VILVGTFAVYFTLYYKRKLLNSFSFELLWRKFIFHSPHRIKILQFTVRTSIINSNLSKNISSLPSAVLCIQTTAVPYLVVQIIQNIFPPLIHASNLDVCHCILFYINSWTTMLAASCTECIFYHILIKIRFIAFSFWEFN